MTVLGGFSTLGILGLLLAHATIRTSSLWLGIGIHSGLIFAKMGFNKVTNRFRDVTPWFGGDITVGIGSILILLLLWFLIWIIYLRGQSDSDFLTQCLNCSIRPIVSGAGIRKTLEACSATSARQQRLESSRRFAAAAPDRSRAPSTGEFSCPNCEDRALAFDCVVSIYQAKGVLRDLIHRFKYGRQFYLATGTSGLSAGSHARFTNTSGSRRIASCRFRFIRPDCENVDSTRRTLSLNLSPSGHVYQSCTASSAGGIRALKHGLTRMERMQNLRNAFALRKNSDVRGKHLLLLDDVLTTGSTLHECASRIARSRCRICSRNDRRPGLTTMSGQLRLCKFFRNQSLKLPTNKKTGNARRSLAEMPRLWRGHP